MATAKSKKILRIDKQSFRKGSSLLVHECFMQKTEKLSGTKQSRESALEQSTRPRTPTNPTKCSKDVLEHNFATVRNNAYVAAWLLWQSPNAVVQHGRGKDALIKPFPADKLDTQKSQRGQSGTVSPRVLGKEGVDRILWQRPGSGTCRPQSLIPRQILHC